MKIEEILHVAREAWGTQTGGIPELPDSYESALRHDCGCGLADWIVIELVEGTDGASDDNRLSEAIRVLDVGARDLLVVVAALRAEELRLSTK